MDNKQLLEIIEKDISDVKNTGQQSINVESLIKYLGELKTNLLGKNDIDIAIANLENARNLAGFDAQVKNNIEMLRSVLISGQAALKYAMLINGGAAIAMLAFVGNIWSKGAESVAVYLTNAIVSFAIGTLVAALGFGSTYLTQYYYYTSNDNTGRVFHISSVILVLMSYALFAVGSYSGYTAFLTHLK